MGGVEEDLSPIAAPLPEGPPPAPLPGPPVGGAEMTSGEAAAAFLAIPDGWGIVDTAASQALIGEKCLDKWTAKLKGKGFQVIRRAATGPAPVGIGGKGKLVGSALVPTRIGEADGIMEFQVMKGDIPPLLPIQALTELGAVIDVPDQKIFLKHLGCEVAMMKLPSQHCAIELSGFREGEVLSLPAPLGRAWACGRPTSKTRELEASE